MRFKLLLAAAAVASFGTAANAQSFTNGSFETGPNPGSFTTLGGGSTAITGWTVTGDSVDYIGDYWQAADGARSIDLNGNGQGGIAQTFQTIGGRSYTVTFSLAGNPDNLPTTKTVSTVATGGGSQNYTFDTSGSTRAAMGWTPQSYSFIAGGAAGTVSLTTLSFASQDAGSFGAALDNVGVSLAAVPEPATWAMMILGFGAVGGAMRRRRSAGVAFA